MDASTAALALIQKWVGPDDKVTDVSGLYDALVEALRSARLEGEEEAHAEDTQVDAARSQPGY